MHDYYPFHAQFWEPVGAAVSRRLLDLHVESASSTGDTPSHPVTVRLEPRSPPGPDQTIKARYVVGFAGREASCASPSGACCAGDWQPGVGCVDVLAITDFPDIRKRLIQSAREGSILVIPREGGYCLHLRRIRRAEQGRTGLQPEHTITA